jgi:hypothetical protein
MSAAQSAVHLPFLLSCFALLVLFSCDLLEYGTLGGADQTDFYKPGDPICDEVMSGLSGEWYSYYAGIGRLDGYRIGKWSDYPDMVVAAGKESLLKNIETSPYKTYGGGDGATAVFTPSSTPPEDYFILYDSSVYGQSDDGAGGGADWNFGFMGIVRAVNIFNGDKKRGAIIIQYLEGCAPQWDDYIKNGQRPFFGIYYRELTSPDIVQMANAVDLSALYSGQKYYTEQLTLNEAIALNTVENEAEFISWGVVIPQDREK